MAEKSIRIADDASGPYVALRDAYETDSGANARIIERVDFASGKFATPIGNAQRGNSAMINAASRNYDPVALRAYAEDHSWTRWAEQAMALFEQVIADHHSVAGCGVRRSLLS